MKTALGACFVAIFLLSCQSEKPQEAKTRPAAVEQSVLVSVKEVEKTDLDVSLSLTGTLRAKTEVDISSKVLGKLATVRVDIGDAVKKGQTIATLESRDTRLAIKQAEAQLASARASKQQADLDAIRMEKLSSSGAATETELSSIQTKQSVSIATMNAAEASLDLARETVRNAIIRSPNKGIVTRRFAEVGQTVSPGVTLFSIHETDEMHLESGVSERDISRIQEGQKVEMIVEAYPDETFYGEVKIIGLVLDPVSRKVPIKIAFPNPAGKLLSQMYGRAKLILEKRADVLVIPQAALLAIATQENPDGETLLKYTHDVWVVKDGIANRRSIKVGAITNGQAEVLDGLEKGEQVITEGQHLLRENTPVQIVE